MDKKYLANFIEKELSKSADEIILSKFEKYQSLLKEWNEKFNLTAILDDQGIIEKHFIDSIYPVKFIDFANKSLCDIGSGAGFPGIPLAILNPTLKVTLVESNGKKITFLNEVVKSLSLDNVKVIKSRVEELNKREAFDFVSARAVTKLNVLSELSIPLLVVNGELLAYKLHDVEEELSRAKNALKLLDSKVEKVEKYNLPISGDGRSLVIVKKLKVTKKKYPREFSKISSKPL